MKYMKYISKKKEEKKKVKVKIKYFKIFNLDVTDMIYLANTNIGVNKKSKNLLDGPG